MPQFLDPTALWYAAAALPVITALYFLKLRRKEQVVSSTLLWRRSVYDLRVNAPVQMIKRNLLLLLQLLIAALVVLALARPFTKLTKASGRQAALLIDCSASMGTRDEEGGKSRLEVAKEMALGIIADLGVKGKGAGDNDELCIIAVSDRAEVLCQLTNDKERLIAAVRSIRLRDSKTDMARGIQEAVNVTRVEQRIKEKLDTGEVKGIEKKEGVNDIIGMDDSPSETKAAVIILSDGAFPAIPHKLADKLAGAANENDGQSEVGAGSRFIRFGKSKSDNLAIVSADLRSDPSGMSTRQLFVRVENMGDKDRTVRLEVFLGKASIDSKMVSIPAASYMAGSDDDSIRVPGQQGVVFDLEGDAEGLLKLHLNSNDSFPADDTVYAVVRLPEPIQALLVTEGNAFLEGALKTLHLTLRYDVMSPSSYPTSGYPKLKDGSPYEIVVFDQFAPDMVPPGASFFIDAVPNLDGIEEDTENSPLFAPMVLDWKRTHGLMKNTSLLDSLRIAECRKIKFSGAWATVMDGQGINVEKFEDLQSEEKLKNARQLEAPLLGCLITEERRVGVLAFDLLKSDWVVKRASFPIFVKNFTHWLTRPGGIQKAELYRTGETLRVQFNRAVAGVMVSTPEGDSVKPPVMGPKDGPHRVYFSDTYKSGVYKVSATGEEDRLFAVNLLSSRESDNAARDSVVIGEEQLRAGSGPSKVNTDLWPYLIMAMLALMTLEWYIFNKRVLG